MVVLESSEIFVELTRNDPPIRKSYHTNPMVLLLSPGMRHSD